MSSPHKDFHKPNRTYLDQQQMEKRLLDVTNEHRERPPLTLGRDQSKISYVNHLSSGAARKTQKQQVHSKKKIANQQKMCWVTPNWKTFINKIRRKEMKQSTDYLRKKLQLVPVENLNLIAFYYIYERLLKETKDQSRTSTSTRNLEVILCFCGQNGNISDSDGINIEG